MRKLLFALILCASPAYADSITITQGSILSMLHKRDTWGQPLYSYDQQLTTIWSMAAPLWGPSDLFDGQADLFVNTTSNTSNPPNLRLVFTIANPILNLPEDGSTATTTFTATGTLLLANGALIELSGSGVVNIFLMGTIQFGRDYATEFVFNAPQAVPVPEPASMILLAVGVILWPVLRRKRRKFQSGG
jgi:hypothetical protein